MATSSKNLKSIKRASVSNYEVEKSSELNQGKLKLVPDAEDAQTEPLSFFLGNDNLASFKIDKASLRNRRRLKLEGWSTGNLSFVLALDGNAVDSTLTRSSRPDVVVDREIPENEDGHGWTIVTEPIDGARAKLWTFVVTLNNGRQNSTREFPIRIDFEPEINKAGSPLGWLESAATSSIAGVAVIAGWAIVPSGFSLWLEQDDAYYPLISDCCIRFNRQDVIDAHRPIHGIATVNAGFVARISELQTELPLNLLAERDGDFSILFTAQVTSIPIQPESAARWLFGVQTPRHLLAHRFKIIDSLLLEPLISHHCNSQKPLMVEIHQLGNTISDPKASIIIPLFGRIDFVEHQLIEFARDDWIIANAEIVYVLDDPKIVNTFAELAHTWHQLYRVPFKWIWGGANRGFSAANNLGVEHSCASVLTFLNSDAFPQKPSWLETLIEELKNNPNFGAVAPRLVFGDGSIQHVGMSFVRHEELGIWINHHPQMGLDPALDNNVHTTEVCSITGACLVIKRETLTSVGGWDTGYLIGDFEDSDLCFKLRANDLRVAYVPHVQLTHLERQSFKLLGHDDFRQKIVIYNAVRHQTRWNQELQELGEFR